MSLLRSVSISCKNEEDVYEYYHHIPRKELDRQCREYLKALESKGVLEMEEEDYSTFSEMMFIEGEGYKNL